MGISFHFLKSRGFLIDCQCRLLQAGDAALGEGIFDLSVRHVYETEASIKMHFVRYGHFVPSLAAASMAIRSCRAPASTKALVVMSSGFFRSSPSATRNRFFSTTTNPPGNSSPGRRTARMTFVTSAATFSSSHPSIMIFLIRSTTSSVMFRFLFIQPTKIRWLIVRSFSYLTIFSVYWFTITSKLRHIRFMN